MSQNFIQIDDEAIGLGQERACYRHPQDEAKVIKVQRGEEDKQTRRELRLYKWLQRRQLKEYNHIPRDYGQVQTNHGEGFVVDLVDDYDGSVSQSLYQLFEQGYPLSEFYPYLEELKHYMLDNRIVFSVDMGRFNILFRKLSPRKARLVVIDGLGNHSAFNWLDNFEYFARRKINRRWDRFVTRLQNYSAQMMEDFAGNPKQLEDAYRKSGYTND